MILPRCARTQRLALAAPCHLVDAEATNLYKRDAGMRFTVVLKTLLFGCLLGVSVWAFRPPPKVGRGVTAAVNLTVGSPDAAYEIYVAPGNTYMPGTIPAGIGEPLRALVDVAEEFVTKHPDTRVVFRNVPSQRREWLITQLASGAAPDIVAVNVEDAWQDIPKGWWLPLDTFLDKPNPYIPAGEPGSAQWWDLFRYQAISRGKAAPDGRMYCITFDMVETGIYYNKTKFRELGIDVPKDWEDFLRIQKVILDAGYTPFLTVSGAHCEWGCDLFFDQLYQEILPGIDLLQDPKREPYLQGYLDWDEITFLYHKGFFRPHDPRWRAIWPIMKDWRRYWNQDLGTLTMDRLRAFVRQEGLMLWDGSWSVHRLRNDPAIDFEWGVFYLPHFTRTTSPYAAGVDQCVIGGAAAQFCVSNRAISDTDPSWPMERRMRESERLKRVVAFLEFLCVPANADRIINESPLFVSNIVGVKSHPSLLPFEEILERRYTTTKWTATFDLQFNNVLERMLELYLNDGISLDGFLEWMDRTLDLATRRAAERMPMDFDAMQRRWDALAPVRAKMTGLPDGVR